MKLYIPVYTVTLFASAFLLFLIQPLFGKMVLPLLGGSPAVWNTAMVFFQGTLLAGYAYAHLAARLFTPRTQAIIHLLLFLLFTTVLPVAIPEGWEPPATNNPTWWQLGLMTVAVGGPFFVLAGTAPLLQYWFAHTDHPEAGNPYFLYAASNFGSMSALIAYPLLVEPLLVLQAQTTFWAFGYGLLVTLIVGCAWLIRRQWKGAPDSQEKTPLKGPPLTASLLAKWVVLAFVPSSLMLGVTSFITTDLASAPLLWILPLALYVSTFIIAFARFTPFSLNQVLFFHGLAACSVIGIFLAEVSVDHFFLISLHLILFFLTALFCHMQLSALRPGINHLTIFYLVMSAGGVLGGIFNALVAPHIFALPFEYALVLALALFLRFMTDPQQKWTNFVAKIKERKTVVLLDFVLLPAILIGIGAGLLFTYHSSYKVGGAVAILIYLALLQRNRWAFAIPAATILLLHPGFHWQFQQNDILLLQRNFFGTMRVANDMEKNLRLFSHGTTLHGAQPLEPEYRMSPLTYYAAGGAADALRILDALPDPQRIAVLGLGAGTMACYARPDRHYDFFEIDPDVVAIAENPEFFTYLSDCGSSYDVILGDARLQLEKQPDHIYDIVMVDIYSSDNIPIHTVTREAFQIYIQKLKPDGAIIVNTSNRYLDIDPVLAAIAGDLELHARFKLSPPGTLPDSNIEYTAASYALLTKNTEMLGHFENIGGWAEKEPAKRLWTDSYSNILTAIRLRWL